MRLRLFFPGSGRKIHGQANNGPCLVFKEKIAVFQAEQENIPGNLYILAAVVCYFLHPALFIPLESLQAVG